jgi:CMP-N-acetylneuraminic acid synthetase
MNDKQRRICTICVRGGSQGVPGKNIRPLLGKPLVAHTIEHAQDSKAFDCLAVSSDSTEILHVAEKWGVDLLIERPDDLATAKAAKLPAIQHAVQQAEKRTGMAFATVVDLDATAPVRTPKDVCKAIRLFETTDASNVITGVPARRSPYFNLVEETEGGYVRLAKQPGEPIVRRQDAPQCYDMNASIYVWGRDGFMEWDVQPLKEKTRLYEMEEHQGYDIDSEVNFVIVEAILKHLKK